VTTMTTAAITKTAASTRARLRSTA
jgi:hypothetical protein